MPDCLVVIDVAADGPIPGDYSILSIGASLPGTAYTPFYAELQPISNRFDPEALAISGLDREELKSRGQEPGQAMRNLANWLASHCAKPAVFCSDNIAHDWMFVCWYFWHFAGTNPLGHAGLDIRSYAMGALDLEWSQSSLKRLPGALAIAEMSQHADLDAQIIAQALEGLRQWRRGLADHTQYARSLAQLV